MRLGALETALRDARRENETLRAEASALKTLRPALEAAAALDAKQPPHLLVERGLVALGALGPAVKDPARAIGDMRSEGEDFRRKLAFSIRENDQLRRDKEALMREKDSMVREREAATRESRREVEALRAELAALASLKALSEAAARVDPRQLPAQVVQRALVAFDALGAVADPARAVADMRADAEALKNRVAALNGELDMARREQEALTRKADALTQEKNTLAGEQAATVSENTALALKNDAQASEDRKEVEALRAEIAALAPLKPLVEAAARVHPGQPPEALLQRALAQLQSTETTGTAERTAGIERDLGVLRAENEELRQRLASADAPGAGAAAAAAPRGKEAPPPCWTNAHGEAQYLLDVTIKDEGLLVRDLAPAARASDPRLRLLRALPRDADIPPELFRRVVDPLFRASVHDRCRFVVTMRDATGPASKQTYKSLRRLVESYFYAKHL